MELWLMWSPKFEDITHQTAQFWRIFLIPQTPHFLIYIIKTNNHAHLVVSVKNSSCVILWQETKQRRHGKKIAASICQTNHHFICLDSQCNFSFFSLYRLIHWTVFSSSMPDFFCYINITTAIIFSLAFAFCLTSLSGLLTSGVTSRSNRTILEDFSHTTNSPFFNIYN